MIYYCFEQNSYETGVITWVMKVNHMGIWEWFYDQVFTSIEKIGGSNIKILYLISIETKCQTIKWNVIYRNMTRDDIAKIWRNTKLAFSNEIFTCYKSKLKSLFLSSFRSCFLLSIQGYVYRLP